MEWICRTFRHISEIPKIENNIDEMIFELTFITNLITDWLWGRESERFHSGFRETHDLHRDQVLQFADACVRLVEAEKFLNLGKVEN